MRRREFITLFGVAALAGPRAARAQQADRVRRVDVLMSRAAGDPEEQARFAGFLQGLQKLGWTTAATCGSTTAGLRPMPTALAHTRRNWSRSRPTSSWPPAARAWQGCYKQLVPCRSCS